MHVLTFVEMDTKGKRSILQYDNLKIKLKNITGLRSAVLVYV